VWSGRFAAHLHCKFAAVVTHPSPTPSAAQTTRFLALDKCLRGRDFLQLVTVERPRSEAVVRDSPSGAGGGGGALGGIFGGGGGDGGAFPPPTLQYDPEWLAIMRATHGQRPPRREIREEKKRAKGGEGSSS
jgi:hypothetical protein